MEQPWWVAKAKINLGWVFVELSFPMLTAVQKLLLCLGGFDGFTPVVRRPFKSGKGFFELQASCGKQVVNKIHIGFTSYGLMPLRCNVLAQKVGLI